MNDLSDVEPVRRAAVAIDDITTSRRDWERANRRPHALSAREALAALEFEALLVSVAALTLSKGTPLSDEDLDRLLIANQRIDLIAAEVLR